MRMLAAAIALALCACSGGGGGSSSSAPPPPPPPPAPSPTTDRVVSGLSAFPAGCATGGGGIVHINAEVEPHLAVNPRDPNHLIAAWQQDRWSNGSARGVASAMSLDGGTTWTHTLVPFTQCAGGEYARGTDPWVAFSPDGTAYQMALVTTGGTFTTGSVNAMVVSRSTDGGRTWSNPVELIRDTTPFFNDKNTITADPLDGRFVYAVWDRLRQNGNGPAYLARTTDGGATWEPARMIYDPGTRSQTIGNQVRVLPNGTLVNLFTQIDETSPTTTTATVRVIRSTDRGVTWSGATTISTHQAQGVRDALTGQAIRDGSIVPEIAAGPDGTVHVVWQDARFTGQRDAIAYSRSTDGGVTWSAPVRVNSDPSAAAFTPQVHVALDGTIGVSYYDLRSRGANPLALPTDYWLARSTDGVTWSETRIAPTFDILTAPVAGGLFLGDYTGLQSAGSTFLSLHARTPGGTENRTDIFFTRIAPATEAAAYAAETKLMFAPDASLQQRVSENIARALAARRVR